MSGMQLRNEWKFLCDIAQTVEIKNRLYGYLQVDNHNVTENGYTVKSLYFDDYFNSCAKDNDAGNSIRRKYRIRYYNQNTDFVRLEIKNKVYDLGYKETAVISLSEYTDIISGRTDSVMWNTDNNTVKKFCNQIIDKNLLPKAIIQYNRLSFIDNTLNIRITFDRNVSVSDDFESFLNGDYMTVPLFEDRTEIMEVKFDGILPSTLKRILATEKLLQASYSKYYYGRKVLNLL